jgi:hypothetical protein
MKVTFPQYCKAFWTLRGFPAAIPVLPPLLGAGAPGIPFTAYLYPPLGDSQPEALGFTVALVFATMFVVFFFCPFTQKARRRVIGILFFVLILSGFFLFTLCERYVRRIELSRTHQDVLVSVGSERSELAAREFSEDNDWEMLHERGPWEEQIQKLWTPHSISVARRQLWLAYSLILVCIVFLTSMGVYQLAADQNSKQSKTQNAT